MFLIAGNTIGCLALNRAAENYLKPLVKRLAVVRKSTRAKTVQIVGTSTKFIA